MGDYVSNRRIAERFLLAFLVLAITLFGSAGTLLWPEAWIYIAIHLGCAFLMARWLKIHDPALLKRRIKMKAPEAGSWDAIFMWPTLILFTIYLIIPGLDAIRFGWSHVPLAVEVAGLVLVTWGLCFIFRVMKANSFASPIIEVQQERDHKVADSGPYAHVRHPMYSAMIVILLALPLWLGSLWALPVGLLVSVVICSRIFAEERMLHAKLEGYSAYCERVRYRLIPGVW